MTILAGISIITGSMNELVFKFLVSGLRLIELSDYFVNMIISWLLTRTSDRLASECQVELGLDQNHESLHGKLCDLAVPYGIH